MTELKTDPLREQATDAFITQLLPGWLKNLSHEQLKTLRSCFQQHVQSQQAVQHAFAGLEPLDAFAKTCLQDGLKVTLAQDIAMDKLQWREERRHLEANESGPTRHEYYFVRLPGLQKLLQNFKRNESFYPLTGLVYPADPATDRAEQVISTDTTRLVEKCRTLDVGKQYQKHLNGVLNTACLAALAEDKRQQLRLAVELAALQRQLPADELALLRRCADEKSQLNPAGLRLAAGSLKTLGVPVEGAMAFEVQALRIPAPNTSPFGVRRVILYLPGAPGRSLHAFANWRDASLALGTWLQEPACQKAFVQRIALADRPAFLETLHKRLQDTRPDATCECVPIDVNVFQALANLHAERIRDDARLLAVPTAQIDARVSAEHWQALASAGTSMLNLAGLFVPVIGALLVADLVAQTLSEFCEGVQDWQLEHQHEAIEHLMGVVETVVISAALVAGTSLVAQGFTRSARLDRLVPVLNDAGMPRLGLMVTESPLDWAGEKLLLSRLWPQAQALDDSRVGHILKVADIDQEHLRGLLVERRTLPVQLRDTLERFAADARVEAFFDQLTQGRVDDAELFLFCTDTLKLAALPRAEQVLTVIEETARLRGPLFDFCSHRYLPADDVLPLMRRDFKGLPDAYALEVLKVANEGQRERMLSEQRIPLAIAERARELLQVARLTRMREGLFLKASYHPDTVALVFALLRKHARLSAASDMQLREGSDVGRVLARLNPQGDPQHIATVLVRRAGVFKCYDLQGREQNVHLDDPEDLTEVLARHLARDDLARLTWDGAQARAQMANALRSWLPATREGQLELMGWRAIDVPHNPLRRLPDGRFGYLLNGRDRLREPLRRDLHEAVGTLYPSLDAQELEEYVTLLLQRPESAYAVIIAQYREYLALDQALDDWMRDAPQGRLREVRRQAADTFRRCWRLQVPDGQAEAAHQAVNRFSLVGADIGNLPVLPEGTNFMHVTELVLAGLRIESLPRGFLHCFSRLRRLDLFDNQLTELPVGLDGLPQLTSLGLSHNRLNMTEASVRTLGSMVLLQELNLSFNPLGAISLRLANLTRLRVLSLRRANLTAVPVDVASNGRLEIVDLRDNQIFQLPEALFRAPLQVRRALLLDNNALPVADRDRLVAPDPMRLPVLPPTDPFMQSRQRWLAFVEPAAMAASTRQWDTLRANARSDEFFRLLTLLSETSDYRQQPQSLASRVWSMVEAANSDSDLRTDLFELAAARGCVDRMISCFSRLEVRVMLAQAMRAGGEAAEEQALLELATGLFRLERVEAIAQAEIERQVTLEADLLRSRGFTQEQANTQASERVDAIEVNLAYRVGLARTLKLPGQPKTMQFQPLAKINQQRLANAAASVRWASRTEALVAFVSQRDFWVAYLERRHAARFAEVKAPFWGRLEEATDESGAAQVQREFDEAVRRLVVQLTRVALDNHPETL